MVAGRKEGDRKRKKEEEGGKRKAGRKEGAMLKEGHVSTMEERREGYTHIYTYTHIYIYI